MDGTMLSPSPGGNAPEGSPEGGPAGEPIGDPAGRPGDAAPISRIVAEVAATFPGERITLGEMAEAFGDRAFGLLILLLLLGSLMPIMASICGLPILLLGAQMGLGRRVPRLPAFLAARSIRRVDLLRLAGTSSRWMRRVESYIRPRPGPLVTGRGDRLFGWLTVYVAIMLILPGPGTNGPPAFGNIVMALGLVEHDNRTMAWGMALTVLGCAFATGVLATIAWLGWEAVRFVV